MEFLALKKSTINDVAKLADVSIKTVSRVLNNEPKVKANTRERVREAMRALKYRPNSSARQLASNRTYILGLIYNNHSGYIARIQDGALDACRQAHYGLLIHPCREPYSALLDELEELILTPRVDGLLLTPPISDLEDVQQLVRKLNCPFVTISRASEQDDLDNVGTNDFEAARQMVAHLVSLGHKRVAFIQGHPDHKAVARRFAGFKQGMLDAGLKAPKSHCPVGDNTFEAGVTIARKLLMLNRAPTALFCANDHMAAGAMKTLHELGLAIPAKVSVAGYDDIPLAARIWPALTTVRQPIQEMSRVAAGLLIARLGGEAADEAERLIPSRLVLRESTGPAPD